MAARHPGYRIAIVCGLYYILTQAGLCLLLIPYLRLIENSICQSFYQTHNPAVIQNGTIDESLCKIDPIQNKLATIFGWDSSIWEIPAIIVAIPFAYLSEKLDRRKLLVVNAMATAASYSYIAILLYFPHIFNINFILVDCLGALAGGTVLIVPLVYSLIAETAPPQELSKILFYIGGSLSSGLLLFQTGGTLLMKTYPWTTYLIGLVTITLAPILMLLVPDPKTIRQIVKLNMYNAQQLDSDEVSALIPPPASTASDIHQVQGTAEASAALISQIRKEPIIDVEDYTCDGLPDPQAEDELSTIQHITTSFKLIPSTFVDVFFTDYPAQCCILLYFIYGVGFGAESSIQVWASRMFGWTYAQTNYILVVQNILNALVLGVLPYFVKKMQSRGSTTPMTSFMVVTGSLAAMSIALFLIGLSASSIVFIGGCCIYVLGAGFKDALQSLTASVLPTERVTRIFIGLSIVNRLGFMLTNPIVAYLLTEGFRTGVTGLPMWFCGAVMMCGCMFALFNRSRILINVW